jgi:hypothetical protein
MLFYTNETILEILKLILSKISKKKKKGLRQKLDVGGMNDLEPFSPIVSNPCFWLLKPQLQLWISIMNMCQTR